MPIPIESTRSRAYATNLDAHDPLRSMRQEYFIPTNASMYPEDKKKELAEGRSFPGSGEEGVYLAGNSLGLVPRSTPAAIMREVAVWTERGVLGHHEHPDGHPWTELDQSVTAAMANLVGAKESEVACMGTLTANLHFLLSSFYKPTATRHKILFEAKAFPSDLYAFASQVDLHGYSSDSLIGLHPADGDFTLTTEAILETIEQHGEEIAVICFGAVHFYSGQWLDMEAITKAGQAKGCIVGWDCAHAIGNVPIQLHDIGADFAAWCTYKYLNSGPGGIAGLFVHERHADRKRLAGWWGVDMETRFEMASQFVPMAGAGGWKMSTPSAIDIIALKSSLSSFARVAKLSSSTSLLSGLREKSIKMTGYLEDLLLHSPHYTTPATLGQDSKVKFTIITPADPAQRGAQLSLLIHPAEAMVPIFESLRADGILGDERKPGVIRLAPVPMYNSFEDCWRAAEALDRAVAEYVRCIET